MAQSMKSVLDPALQNLMTHKLVLPSSKFKAINQMYKGACMSILHNLNIDRVEKKVRPIIDIQIP